MQTCAMKNKWKIAFIALMLVFLTSSSFFVYAIIDQAYSITYLREGYQDTEHDLEQISRVIEGRLTRKDFSVIDDRYVSKDSACLELNRIKILFGEDQRVQRVSTNW